MKQTFVFLFTALLLSAVPALAQQSIEAVAEKNTIMLGEPLMVTISVVGGQQYKAIIPDTLGHFEVLEQMPPTSTKHNGDVITQQQIIVTSFDSGRLRIPPIAVEGNPNLVSSGIEIVVNTLLPDAKTEYGDLKQIISLEPPSQWPYLVALTLVVLLSALGLWWLNRKLQLLAEVMAAPQSAEPVSQSSLLLQLQLLKTEWQQNRVASGVMGNRLMEIFRKYLSGRNIYAPSKTGEELIIATKSIYNAAGWQQVVQSIRLCNAMRFGKYNASIQEGNEAIDAFTAAISKPTPLTAAS